MAYSRRIVSYAMRTKIETSRDRGYRSYRWGKQLYRLTLFRQTRLPSPAMQAKSSRTMWIGCSRPLSRLGLLGILLAICALTTGCFKKFAVNKLGSALADEDDPELVKAAVPFGLKLMESLLAESPKHPELLFATASGFTRYAYAFVQEEADELEDRDLNGAMALRERARKLYLRARNYGLRGLEIRHPGFERKLWANSKQALRTTSAKDVPMLYWTAVSWAASISMGKDTPELIADLPLAEAIIDRALELNERFGEGAIHAFLITYEMSRQGAAGDAAARSRRHFERAMEISRGQQAGPLVALAEAVCV